MPDDAGGYTTRPPYSTFITTLIHRLANQYGVRLLPSHWDGGKSGWTIRWRRPVPDVARVEVSAAMIYAAASGPLLPRLTRFERG